MEETRKDATDVVEFDYDKIMREKVAINCKTEEQAKNLLKWADSKGLTWSSGISYLEKTDWYVYREYNCYDLFSGVVGLCTTAPEDFGYRILSYKEALLKSEPSFTYPIYCKNKVTKSIVKFIDLTKGECIEGVCAGIFEEGLIPHTDTEVWEEIEEQKASKGYLVTVSGKFAPKKVHSTLESAKKEAQRLAKKELKEVIVSEIVTRYSAEIVVNELD